MAITTEKLYNGVVGTGPNTLYTVPGGTKVVLKSLSVANVVATTIKITIYLDGTALLYNHDVPPGESLLLSVVDQVLEAGDIISATSDTADSAAILISGRAGVS